MCGQRSPTPVTIMSFISQYFSPVSPYTVSGSVAPGYQPVRELFEENFLAGEESCAQLCVYLGEERIIGWLPFAYELSGTDYFRFIWFTGCSGWQPITTIWTRQSDPYFQHKQGKICKKFKYNLIFSDFIFHCDCHSCRQGQAGL